MNPVILVGDNTDLLVSLKNSNNIELVDCQKYKFSNDNILYKFKDIQKYKNLNIVADLSKNLHENLWGLLNILDSLNRNNIEIDKLVFPYLPYSRSNSKYKNHTAPLFSFIKYLNLHPIRKIYVFDPHFGNQPLPFRAVLKRIRQINIFENILNEIIQKNTLIIGPDQGSENRIFEICENFNCQGFHLKKYRNDHKEKVNIKISNIQLQKIKNSDHICIFDDEICSGGTITNTVDKILKINDQTQIDVFITHFFMRNINSNLLSKINHLYTTNSIDSKIKSSKLQTIDLSNMILREINA